jgi:hypothetical protein
MHKIRGHAWVDGQLTVEERFFATLEEAISHASGKGYHSFKVYDHNNTIIHADSTVDANTYA